MATEPLEYKVTFDTSEVAQKLSEVKNAMDVAFGAQAFNAAGPDVFPFQQLFQTSALTNLTGATPATFGVPESLSTAMTSAREGVQMAQNTFGSIQSVFSTLAETSRLGYSKFTRDLEMTGLMAGGMRGAPQALTYGQQMQQIKEGGFWDDITGSMGFGYTPTMTMSQAEYKRAYKKQAPEDFMEPSWGEAGGVALGFGAAAAFGAGPIGWTAAAIPAVALAGKAALYPFTSELRHQRALEDYVRGTSWRFLSGEFNREDTEELGQYLRELPDQPGIATRDYSRGEVDEMLSTFTEAGGFDYVRNARDYREKTKQLFEGHRELMHTLHVTSKEATALMAQLSRDLGIDNFAAFSGEVGALAAGAGLTGSEAASFIMKSSEMVRGTGYNMENFALSAGRMLQDVQAMAQRGIISDEDLRQFGGAQGIALNMARSAMNYMGSPAGFVTSAALASAQLGGGGMGDVAGMSFQQKLGVTAGYLSDPWSILTFDPEAAAEQMGPQVAMMDLTSTYLDKLTSLVGDKKMTGREFEVAIQKLGATKGDARQLRYQFETAGRDIPTLREQNDAAILQYYRQRQDEGESPFGRQMRLIGAGIEEAAWDPLTDWAEDVYIGIEDIYKGTERSLGNLIYDVTGGIFTTETTKPQGLIAALGMGEDYAKKHDRAMSMDASQRSELRQKIVEGGDPNLLVNQTKRVSRLQTGIRGGAQYITEKVSIANLNANDARRETARILENQGEDRTFGSVNWWATIPIFGAYQLLAGATKPSAEMEYISETATTLGMRDRAFQTNLARMFYYGEMDYEEFAKEGETEEAFKRRRVIEDIEAAYGKKLGKKGMAEAIDFIGGLSSAVTEAFTLQGAAQDVEDLKTFKNEMEDVARRKLIKEKGMSEEDITPEVLNAAVLKLEEGDVRAFALDTERETMEGREAATESYRERFRRQYKMSPEEALLKKTDAGGTVFSAEGAQQVEAINNIKMTELLTQLVNGNTNNPLPVTVALDVFGIFG